MDLNNIMLGFKRVTWFTGRNGMFKAKGIELWNAVDDLVVITPITTKNKSARCDIAIPKESIPELIDGLNKIYKQL